MTKFKIKGQIKNVINNEGSTEKFPGLNTADVPYFSHTFQGFIILAMYVMSGEVLVIAPILHKLKRQAESDDECASEQTKGVYSPPVALIFSNPNSSFA